MVFGKNRDEIVIEETSSLHKPVAKNDEELNLLKRKVSDLEKTTSIFRPSPEKRVG